MTPEIEVTCPTVNTLNSLNIEHEAKVTNALNTLNIEHEAKIANTLDSLKNEYQAKIVKLNQDIGNCRNPQTIGEYFSNFSLYLSIRKSYSYFITGSTHPTSLSTLSIQKIEMSIRNEENCNGSNVRIILFNQGSSTDCIFTPTYSTLTHTQMNLVLFCFWADWAIRQY